MQCLNTPIVIASFYLLYLEVYINIEHLMWLTGNILLLLGIYNGVSVMYVLVCHLYGLPITITVFALIFSPTCPKAKFRKKLYLKYRCSNKFFHNFHLSESSFTCPELQASGFAWRLPLLFGIWICIFLYLCNLGLSPLRLRRGVLDTTLCDKFCKCLKEGLVFLDTQDFSTDIAENRLKVTIILQTQHKPSHKIDAMNFASWKFLLQSLVYDILHIFSILEAFFGSYFNKILTIMLSGKNKCYFILLRIVT